MLNLMNTRLPFHLRQLAVAVAILSILTLAAGRAAAMSEPRVRDDAGFFSPDAVAKANEQIAHVKRDFGKDVYVETVPSISEDRKAQYQPEHRAEFFAKWADERARAEKVDGLIVFGGGAGGSFDSSNDSSDFGSSGGGGAGGDFGGGDSGGGGGGDSGGDF